MPDRPTECNIWLSEEIMKKVRKFTYLDTSLCKHGSKEGEGQTGDWYNGETYERKECEHGGKEGYQKQPHLQTDICIRVMEVKCSHGFKQWK